MGDTALWASNGKRGMKVENEKKAKVAENEKAQGFKVDTKHFERETDIPNEHSM